MTYEEAQRQWREIHRNCRTAAQQVAMTETPEYKELVAILFPDNKTES